MADDGRHERVLDTLLDLQAHLRGDAESRRIQVSEKEELAGGPEGATDGARAAPDPTPSLRLAPEPVSVRSGDVEVVEAPEPTGADRLAALSERLRRVEQELTSAMDRLRTAEERYVGDDELPEPPPESSEREVYQRVMQLQHLASDRGSRRRRR